MAKELYRYQFTRSVSLQDVEETLFLAVLATEFLHGQARVRLDAAYCIEDAKHTCIVDASTDVGLDICRLFTGFAMFEFGENAFRIERVEGSCKQAAAGRRPSR